MTNEEKIKEISVKNSENLFFLGSTLILFSTFSILLLVIGLLIEWFFIRETCHFTVFLSWGICYISGMLSFILSWRLERKYRLVIATVGTGMFIRSGFPLISVLVLFFILDKIILKQVILEVAIIYMVMLPYEVWLFLPQKNSTSQVNKHINK